MKSFQHSFRLLLSQYKGFARQLWRPYLALSLAVTLLVVGAVRLATLWLLPTLTLRSQGVAEEIIAQVFGVDFIGLAFLLFGGLSTLFASLWGHRATLRVATPYARPQQAAISGERRVMRLSLSASLLLMWLLIGGLPFLTIALGISTLSLAQLQDDAVMISTTLWLCLAATVAASVLVLQVLALYIRLVLTHRAF